MEHLQPENCIFCHNEIIFFIFRALSKYAVTLLISMLGKSSLIKIVSSTMFETSITLLLRIDNSRQERFGSGRAYPHFIHSYLMASLMIIQ